MVLIKFAVKKSKIFNQKTIQVAIPILFAFALLFYAYLLIVTRIEVTAQANSTTCDQDEKWNDLLVHMSIVDLVLTILIPFVLIILVNGLISAQLRFKPNGGGGRDGEGGANGAIVLLHDTMKTRRTKIYQKSNRNLFCISFAYVVLNLPFAVLKLKSLISLVFVEEARSQDDNKHLNISRGVENATAVVNDELFQIVANYLYCLNYTINFFLYVINVKEFRDLLWNLIKKTFC